MKTFPDHNLNVNQKFKIAWEGEKTLREKEKMLVTSIFSFLTMFTKGFFLRVIQIRDCVVRVNQEFTKTQEKKINQIPKSINFVRNNSYKNIICMIKLYKNVYNIFQIYNVHKKY